MSAIGSYEEIGPYRLDTEKGELELSTFWNGRIVNDKTNQLAISLARLINMLLPNNSRIDHFSYPIGTCPRGHRAYHIYHQTAQPPINLCDEKREWCIFEYYNFLAFLRGEYDS